MYMYATFELIAYLLSVVMVIDEDIFYFIKTYIYKTYNL